MSFLTIAILLFNSFSAMASSSEVYSCQFQESTLGNSRVRMKKYFDPNKNEFMGQVDLIEDNSIITSAKTKVFQFRLLDGQNYIQIWFSSTMRLDAQLHISQGFQPFPATIHIEKRQDPLICRLLIP